MITKEEAKKLKEDIGTRHTAQISTYFIKTEFFNKWREPYTSDFISRVLNGRVENLKVEKEIRFFAELRKKEDEKDEERRRKILEEAGPNPEPEV